MDVIERKQDINLFRLCCIHFQKFFIGFFYNGRFKPLFVIFFRIPNSLIKVR